MRSVLGRLIAAAAVTLVGCSLDERGHFAFVEPAQRHLLDGFVAPQISEQLRQRMTAIELRVPIRADHEQRCVTRESLGL